MPRLAFEIIYATGLRGRSDATRLDWQHVVTGNGGALWIGDEFRQAKTGGRATQPLFEPDLLRCLEHCERDVVDIKTGKLLPFLRNPTGHAFTADHFSSAWRKWAADAGLPRDFLPHGGRKMIACDMVDAAISVEDGRRVTGHADDSQFREYAQASNAKRGALRAQQQLVKARRGRRTACIGYHHTLERCMNPNSSILRALSLSTSSAAARISSTCSK
jgi:site-specific recombinase XerC